MDKRLKQLEQEYEHVLMYRELLFSSRSFAHNAKDIQKVLKRIQNEMDSLRNEIIMQNPFPISILQ